MTPRPSKTKAAAATHAAQRRNDTLSQERIAIERLLRRLPDGETLSAKEIATRTHTCPKRTASILQSLRKCNQAVNTGNTSVGKWCATQREKQASCTNKTSRQRNRQGFLAHPDDPICNGNRDNGSLAYWQTYQARLMAPARQPAGQ